MGDKNPKKGKKKKKIVLLPIQTAVLPEPELVKKPKKQP